MKDKDNFFFKQYRDTMEKCKGVDKGEICWYMSKAFFDTSKESQLASMDEYYKNK